MLRGATDSELDRAAALKCASLVQRVALLVLPADRKPGARAAGASSRFLRGSTKITERLRAKRRPAKALSAAAGPPAPKHRTDEEERGAHSESGARGQWGQGGGARLSYQETPAGSAHGVYLIHRMPDISTSPDAPSPGQSRSLIRPRGRSLQR